MFSAILAALLLLAAFAISAPAMTALAANKPRSMIGEVIERLRVIAGAKVYAGSTLQWDDAGGTPTNGVEAFAGGVKDFAGFSREFGDNTSGALGDVVVEVAREGFVFLTLTGVTVTMAHIGDTVYALTDDDTFNLTAGATPIGKVAGIVTLGASNLVVVKFQAVGFESV